MNAGPATCASAAGPPSPEKPIGRLPTRVWIVLSFVFRRSFAVPSAMPAALTGSPRLARGLVREGKLLVDRRIRLPIHLHVRVDEVVQRFPRLLGAQRQVPPRGELHSVFVVAAVEV